MLCNVIVNTLMRWALVPANFEHLWIVDAHSPPMHTFLQIAYNGGFSLLRNFAIGLIGRHHVIKYRNLRWFLLCAKYLIVGTLRTSPRWLFHLSLLVLLYFWRHSLFFKVFEQVGRLSHCAMPWSEGLILDRPCSFVLINCGGLVCNVKKFFTWEEHRRLGAHVKRAWGSDFVGLASALPDTSCCSSRWLWLSLLHLLH